MMVVILLLEHVIVTFFNRSSDHKRTNTPPKSRPYRLESAPCTELGTVSPRFQASPRILLVNFTRLWFKNAYHVVGVCLFVDVLFYVLISVTIISLIFFICPH